VLGYYAREQQLFSMEQAVHKMTGLSARNFRLHGRGEIRAGCFADVVVFDPARVRDLATYEQPQRRCEGIERVYVNGQLALTSSTAGCERRAGKVLLRRPG
jgi:N-acyl-D-amino-acid deacylase